MQVSNTLIAVTAEVYLTLLIAVIIFFVHSRKLKSLVRRQQEKLIELLRERQNNKPVAPKAQPVAAPIAEQSYKSYLNNELDTTASQFAVLTPTSDIAAEQPLDSPLFQRILALRYAFLRAEELGTTEPAGSEGYWNIFQQTLAPFLASSSTINQELESELETCKKRIENLEKFKRLFFDMEKQWSDAQSNAQNYYNELMALSDGVSDRDSFNETLIRYHNVYDDIHNTVITNIQNPDSKVEYRAINVIRQDPRAAEEILKLRNVAADQHRVINQLQRKLVEAKTSEEKEIVIQELQQQLQRQTRFVQESETCVQLLEDELGKIQEQLSLKEKALDETNEIGEENQRMKSTLQSFTLESKDMMISLNDLEKENDALKQNIRAPQTDTLSSTSAAETISDIKKIQGEFSDLKKQYAELEERYLELKMSK